MNRRHLLLLSLLLASHSAAQQSLPTTPPSQETAQRVTDYSVAFQAKVLGRLILALQVPAGTTVIPGSFRLGGVPVQPVSGPSGTLYFQTSLQSGLLQYQLQHSGPPPAPLPLQTAQYQPDTARLTVITPEFNQRDFQQASRPATTPAERPSGLIRFPLEGATTGSSTNVHLVYQGNVPDLLVNGVIIPTSRIGTRLTGENHGELTYIAVPLLTGPNTIQAGNETVTVYRPGTATQLQFEALSISADGFTPNTIKITTQDASGHTADLGSVTLRISGAQPATPDASPTQSGYQLALQQGVGYLRLKPQTTGEIEITAWKLSGQYRARLTPDSQGSLAAYGSLTLPLADPSTLTASQINLEGKLTADLPFAGGNLKVNADSTGGQVLSEIDSPRHVVRGDAGTVTQDVTSRGPVALTYENLSDHQSGFKATYALKAGIHPLTGQAANTDSMNVTAFLNDRWSLHADFALLNSGLRELTFSEDQLVLDLGANVAPYSETLSVTRVLDGQSRQDTLTRGVDYSIQYLTGTVVLTRTVPRDPNTAPPTITVQFSRPGDPASDKIQYGVSARYAYGNASRQTITSASGGDIVMAAVAEADQANSATFGVRTSYRTPNLAARSLIMYNAGLNGSGWHAEAEIRQQSTRTQTWVRATSQSENYPGPLKTEAGTVITAETRLNVLPEQPGRPGFNVIGRGEYNTVRPGRAEVLAEISKQKWSVAGGLSWLTDGNLQAVAELGYGGSGGLRLRQATSLNGGQNETRMTGNLPLTDHLTLKADNRLGWGEGGAQNQGSIGVNAYYGVSQYDVTYELPSSSGQPGRWRTGVSAEWPLDAHWTVGGRLNLYVAPSQAGSASASVRYSSNPPLVAPGGVNAGTQASLTVEGSYDSNLKFGVKTSLTHVSGRWTVGETGQSVFGNQSGHDYALGLAWRGDRAAFLSTTRYRTALFTSTPALSHLSEFSLAYKAFDLRTGLLLESRTPYDSLTWLVSFGTTAWITERLGIGARYALNGNTASRNLNQTFSVEGTLVPVQGVGVSAGYTYAPNSPSTLPAPYRPGFYLRFDTLIGH